jgi:hypothetical protein
VLALDDRRATAWPALPADVCQRRPNIQPPQTMSASAEWRMSRIRTVQLRLMTNGHLWLSRQRGRFAVPEPGYLASTSQSLDQGPPAMIALGSRYGRGKGTSLMRV